MGTVSAAAEWTAEDDVLLKNAVEVTHAARTENSPSAAASNSHRTLRPARLAPQERNFASPRPLPAPPGRSVAPGVLIAFDSRHGTVGIAACFGFSSWGAVLVRRVCDFGGANRSAEIELKMRSCSLPVAY